MDIPGITMVELSTLVTTDRRTLSLYLSKLRKYWCPFVVSLGKCSQACSTDPFCAPHVLEILSGDFTTARSLDAVILYRIRNEKARVSEELSRQEKEPIQRTILGEIRTENIFSQMMSGD